MKKILTLLFLITAVLISAATKLEFAYTFDVPTSPNTQGHPTSYTPQNQKQPTDSNNTSYTSISELNITSLTKPQSGVLLSMDEQNDELVNPYTTTKPTAATTGIYLVAAGLMTLIGFVCLISSQQKKVTISKAFKTSKTSKRVLGKNRLLLNFTTE